MEKTHGYASAFLFLSLAMVCSALAVLPLMNRKTVVSQPVID
ncbi:hypothetical protein [Serratia marcescens]|nr:hypothetical protein [Serratia marcescens]